MKKLFTLFLIAAVAIVGSVFAPKSAEAVPAFARQVGVPCYSCHYQYIPKLNSFGREFKLGGYTQTAQELIEDDGISLPPVANIGFIMKYRYLMDSNKKSSGTKVGHERGQWELYDEAAVWFAGRLAENWGLAVEFPGPSVSTKIVYSKNFGGMQGGFTVFQTDALGAAFGGQELYNTGAVRNHRQWENRGATNIQQQLGSSPGMGLGGAAAGPATGGGVFAGGDLFYAYVGLIGPLTTVENEAGLEADVGFEFGNYYRLAITPKISEGMDLMIGIQGYTGQTKASGGSGFQAAVLGGVRDGYANAMFGNDYANLAGADQITVNGAMAANGDALTEGEIWTLEVDSMAIDFQLQMDLGGRSLEVVAAFMSQGEDHQSISDTSGDTVNDGEKATGWHLGAALGLTPHAGVKLNYLSVDYDAADGEKTAFSVGGWINLAQNITFMPEYSSWSGDEVQDGDPETQIMALFIIGF